MRLRRLVLSNIGPYVGLTELDFAELGDVFLVCGKTGSGKSTIFDAVSYALYGSGIGTREIVSHYAAADDEVFVDLELELGRQRWRVQRKPARTVAKKRGSGTTDRPAEAALWVRRGSGWEAFRDKPSEVDAAVAGILGLSAEEFIKIVLLPQGEFQRFLEMRTSDRAAILEKLFPVESYAAVSELARLKAKEAEATARGLDEEARAMESSLGDDPEGALAGARAALADARAAEAAALAARDAAARAAQAAGLGARAWAERDAAVAQKAALEGGAAEAASLAARLARAEAGLDAAPAVAAARRARGERADAEKAKAEGLASLDSFDARKPGIDASERRSAELSAELEGLGREEGILSARAASWERLSVASARLEAASLAENDATAVRELGAAALAAAQAALAELESGAASAEALATERQAALASLEAALEAERLAKEAERLAEELSGLRARVAAAEELRAVAEARRTEAAAALAEAERLSQARGDEQAAERLAARLRSGAPCPVCGSSDHPAPAVAEAMGRVPTEASALDTEAVLLAARKAARDEEHRAAAASAALAELQRSLAEKEAAAGDREGEPGSALASAVALAARARLRAADEAFSSEAKRAARAAGARDDIEERRKTLDAARTTLAAASAERLAAAASADEARSGAGESDPLPLLAALREARARALAEKARLSTELEAWNRGRQAAAARAREASLRLERSEAELAETEPALEKALAEAGFADEEAWSAASMAAPELAEARRLVRARADAESEARSRLAAAERSVAGLARPDTVAAEAALTAASGAYSAARASMDEAARAERELSAALDALAGVRGRRAALRERGDRLALMSRLLNGDLEGRRLSFKNFALASYFALVVELASARLREMSDGRYDMSVASARSGGRGRVGLDLAVLDSYTGVARPASSLSGGEKFLASISLALGLSEAIVARAGGAALDSIFIDEGFGSLDDETLDRAMAALDRVRGERVIGIVSHVAELKTRVPARVEVVKSSSGSTLRVVS